MIKILFLCHGNICRSPIAEFVFKNLIKDCKEDFYVDSKAVSRDEIGNGIYPPAKAKLREKNIPFDDHYSSQITLNDYRDFDYIIVMEDYNIPRLMHIIGEDTDKKVYKLLDFTDTPGDIEDPWYSGNYEKVFNQITEGCKGLLQYVLKNNKF